MKNIFLILTGFSVFLAAAPAGAKSRPLQLSLLSPVQLFRPTDDITGLSLGAFYSKNRNVRGLALNAGFNSVTNDFAGVLRSHRTRPGRRLR